MSQINIYQKKEDDYYNTAQPWVADLFDDTGLTVLDIGCGDGATSGMLKKQGIAHHVTGIEIIPESANRAKERIDVVLVGNVEQMSFQFEKESFDALIMTELLEHLVNPWEVIVKVTKYLKPGGFIIASSPNVRHYSVIWKLLRGKWEYETSGILDQTHLRFFIKQTFVDLFTAAGLEVELIRPIMKHRHKRLNRLLFGSVEGFLTHRYSCRVRKPLR